MNQDNQNNRTGAELLLDKYIEAIIHESPLAFPELRKDIYIGLEKVAKDEIQGDDSFLEIIENLTPQQTTAYKILEKMGMIDLSTGFCYVTEQGFAVYESLRREGVYKDSTERYRSCNIDFD